MWVYRVGAERAMSILFTGDQITERKAANMGLVSKALPEDQLDAEVMAERLATVPLNQLAMQKMVVNQAVEAAGRLALGDWQPCRTVSRDTHPRARTSSAGWKSKAGNRRYRNGTKGHSTGQKTSRFSRMNRKNRADRIAGNDMVTLVSGAGAVSCVEVDSRVATTSRRPLAVRPVEGQV